MKGFAHERPGDGATHEWYTPPWIFEALAVRFDLDPCHPEGPGLPWVPAERRFTIIDDGLTQPWRGSVWLNPPYGPQTERWLRKLAQHGDGIALVHARVDTGWFHDAAATADAVLFLRGRIQFVSSSGKDGTQPASPSMLLAWGARHVEALDRVAALGKGLCVRLPRPVPSPQAELALGAAA